MKMIFVVLLISIAVITIGALENPCTTEGLPTDCIKSKLNQ